jgi:CheY-like chemotaxis protein
MAWSILFVEDDVAFREVVVQGLSLLGHSVQEAEHGARAFEMLASGCKPGIILLDIVMPVMDGIRFLELKNASEQHAHIPVVIMSATEHRLHHGAAALLCKPFELPELQRVISRHYSLLQ